MNNEKTGLPRLDAGETPESLPRTRRKAAAKEAADVHIVRRDSDSAHVLASPVRHGRPIAHASQAAPCAGRTQWHIMYACTACGGTHFGRSPVELKTGKRLARCGRVVWLVIARTYRARRDSAGAA